MTTGRLLISGPNASLRGLRGWEHIDARQTGGLSGPPLVRETDGGTEEPACRRPLAAVVNPRIVSREILFPGGSTPRFSAM